MSRLGLRASLKPATKKNFIGFYTEVNPEVQGVFKEVVEVSFSQELEMTDKWMNVEWYLPRVVPCFPLLGLTPSALFMGLRRVSMGLTVRRKTAKNLAVRRKNERILAVSRKKN